jgi:hypothetical protein
VPAEGFRGCDAVPGCSWSRRDVNRPSSSAKPEAVCPKLSIAVNVRFEVGAVKLFTSKLSALPLRAVKPRP